MSLSVIDCLLLKIDGSLSNYFMYHIQWNQIFKGRSVTAKIGLYVESDLSMYFQEILLTNLLGLFGFAGNT
jgi:hypothetical protein